MPLASYPVGKFAFGNQAEYLLAKLALAKDLNRCLVLPDMTDLLGTLRSPPNDVRFENLFDPAHIDKQQCVISVAAFLKVCTCPLMPRVPYCPTDSVLDLEFVVGFIYFFVAPIEARSRALEGPHRFF